MHKEPDLSKSQKRESDLEKDEAGVSRVGRVHGGELVELISKDDVRPEYDTGCKHIGMFDVSQCKQVIAICLSGSLKVEVQP